MFKSADDEFQPIAKELYEKHRSSLSLSVPPKDVIFLRSDATRDAFAYCKKIGEEYRFITTKKFFIIIVDEHFDGLATKEERNYVLLHEMSHLYYDDEKEKYYMLKHNVQDFKKLLVNPEWNLELTK